jgi:hypothetical protein
MNKLNAQAFLPLIKAYSEGKTIQVRTINGFDNWEDLRCELRCLRDPSDYRIKPEPKTVPLTIEDLYEHFKKGTIFKIKANYWLERITSISITTKDICISEEIFPLERFCNNFTFEDGSPLTKIVKE